MAAPTDTATLGSGDITSRTPTLTTTLYGNVDGLDGEITAEELVGLGDRALPASSAFYPLDSGAMTFASTSGTWTFFPVGNAAAGTNATTVWFKPRGRALRAGDIIQIQPRFTIASTALTDAAWFCRAVIVSGTDGSVLRIAGRPGSFGVAAWRVREGTTVGATEVQLGTPIFHRIRADEIVDGGVFVDLQYTASHTAGSFTLVETPGFVAYGPGALLVSGPFETIAGTGLVFTGQSLANVVIGGDFEDLYPRKVINTLIGDGFEVGFWQNNYSASRYDQRDYWQYLHEVAGMRYERVIVIDDGGTSDIDNAETAAGIMAEIEAASDAVKGLFETGVVKYVKLTIPDSSSFTGSEDTVRTDLNALIVADANDKLDAVVDLDSVNADFADNTSALFGDNVHFSPAGHAAAATAVVAAIRDLLL